MKMCILNGSNMELVVFQIGIHDSLFYVSGKIVLIMPLYTTICYCGPQDSSVFLPIVF
uniref:Uncharacterized protein n=1 Tax=Spermophilus dauricus TaxID=99837 RepID=A0A8C9Q6M2_SPEDA